MKAKRDQGLAVENIFHQQLEKFPRFQPLLQAGALRAPYVTSFRGRVHRRAAGPNWLVVGEAASMAVEKRKAGLETAVHDFREPFRACVVSGG